MRITRLFVLQIKRFTNNGRRCVRYWWFLYSLMCGYCIVRCKKIYLPVIILSAKFLIVIASLWLFLFLCFTFHNRLLVGISSSCLSFSMSFSWSFSFFFCQDFKISFLVSSFVEIHISSMPFFLSRHSAASWKLSRELPKNFVARLLLTPQAAKFFKS